MTKDDNQPALSFLDQTCTAALHDIPAQNVDSAPLHIVITDIHSLLALIYNLSTKLAIALKPPAPAHSASIPLLNDLAQHVSALAHATRLLHDDLHGAVLAKDIRNRVIQIIDVLRALVRSFLNNPEEYLLITATLHDLITSARSPSGIPKDNQSAVYRSWNSDRESLDDNLHEIARIIQHAESKDDTPTDFDDGWDEIGLTNATNLDKDELARAKNVHQLLRLTTLLHKRIYLDLLPYPSSAPHSTFDNLLLQSNLLLSTSDDLVAALYTPQDPDHVHKEILQLANIATLLQTQTAILLPTTDQLTHALSSPSKKRADKKWFDTCVDQILRLCSRLTESSNPTSAT